MSTSRSTTPLPEPFYSFFTILEPLLTAAGALYALLFSETYHLNLVSLPSEQLPVTPAARSALHSLGNTWLILAAMSAYVLPSLVEARGIELDTKVDLLKRFFGVLAVADVTHVALALFDMHADVRFDVFKWNTLAWGNVGITTMLFLWRCAWFNSHSKSHHPKSS